MKILLTGATGFVGKNFLSALTDHSISVLSRNELCNPQIGSAEVIIHLAGKAHDLKQTSNPEDYYKVNFELTKKIYDAYLSSGATKFIFFSSVKASADIVPLILKEESRPNPQTDYGKSKLLAEKYIQEQPLPTGKSFYILRPCMIHGPGNKGNLNLLYGVVRKRFPYPLAAFNNRRSFLSIENLNFVVENLINSNIDSGIYNVADDDPLSTNQVIELISKVLGFKAKLWKISPVLIQCIAKIGNVLYLPLNTERLKKLTESFIVSNEKIKRALNIKKFPVSSTEGLFNTIKSFNLK
ncbi:NAD-dependent epimerase/dehydratase family protein [Pedobacter hiemivivus]|uniref:NAD-dependent epimerase/dehydratase family protein n=1 Tax=Pedobacter hiemivivus TaxID=2530454 RepID=A0A4R0NBD3_9SPHI|nr:NAD-dependent epimerase/dehydratase family protein [Pedobacter hiemivivus]TCC96232.1 NAD-dependent epimerase/dehydratase family protein [Pedobacter hiemivivus]